jgi:hypothetical protein
MASRKFESNKLYQMEVYPVLLSCNFVVDSTNGNGLGIRSLKGAGIQNVFMHTSATPGVGNPSLNQPASAGPTNPNPASGLILVQLQDNYNRNLSGFNSIVSPLSGSPLTSTTAGNAYVIVSLGTTTLAQWQAAGLPIGFVPTVGQAFIAKQTGAIGGTGSVELPSDSGIASIETVGDPNQTISNMFQNARGGAQLVLQCLNGSSSLTAPANNSVISLNFYLSNSSIQISGQ